MTSSKVLLLEKEKKNLFSFCFLLTYSYLCKIMEKVILGIDPGTNIMGYGVIKVTDGRAEMVTMGVIDLRKFGDGYLKLGHIFERMTGIINAYLPDEMAMRRLSSARTCRRC